MYHSIFVDHCHHHAQRRSRSRFCCFRWEFCNALIGSYEYGRVCVYGTLKLVYTIAEINVFIAQIVLFELWNSVFLIGTPNNAHAVGVAVLDLRLILFVNLSAET